MHSRRLAAWVLALAPLAVAGSGCSDESQASGNLDLAPDAEERIGTVGDFTLTERSGATVTAAALRGHPWIASFVFTTCAGPCPRITGNLRDVQPRLAQSGVKLVSFSVDPQTDTPEVLSRYAEAFQADPARWLFLTGDEAALHALIRQSFLLGVQRSEPPAALGMQVSHSARVVVVDPEGRIAGYYDGDDPAGVARAVERALALDRPSR